MQYMYEERLLTLIYFLVVTWYIQSKLKSFSIRNSRSWILSFMRKVFFSMFIVWVGWVFNGCMINEKKAVMTVMNTLLSYDVMGLYRVSTFQCDVESETSFFSSVLLSPFYILKYSMKVCVWHVYFLCIPGLASDDKQIFRRFHLRRKKKLMGFLCLNVCKKLLTKFLKFNLKKNNKFCLFYFFIISLWFFLLKFSSRYFFSSKIFVWKFFFN